MIIETPQLPEETSGNNSLLIFTLIALAVTGGILYWQYRKGDESENTI